MSDQSSLFKSARQIIRSCHAFLTDGKRGALRTFDVNSLIDFDFDDIVLDDSGNVTDIYNYYNKTTLVGRIEVTYRNNSKRDEIRWTRVSI